MSLQQFIVNVNRAGESGDVDAVKQVVNEVKVSYSLFHDMVVASFDTIMLC